MSKKEREKTIAAYSKQIKGRCHECGKHSHKQKDPKCPWKKVMMRKKKIIKKEVFMHYVTNVVKKDTKVKFVMFANVRKQKRKRYKRKVQFRENIKEPRKAGMFWMMDVETFHSFMKNTWISSTGTSCHITNDDTGHFDVTKINELVHGSSSIMTILKRGKLQMKVH